MYYTYKYAYFILKELRDLEVKKIISFFILIIFIMLPEAIAIEEVQAPQAVSVKKEKRREKKAEKSFLLEPFWEDYNDELLNGYIQEALENNLSVKIAEDRIKESEAILGTVNAQRLPQLSINPSVYPFRTISRWTGNFGSGNLLYFPLLLNWELDIFGKISDRVQASKMGVKISKEDLDIAKLSVSSEIAASYFNIILQDSLIKNYEEIVSNLDETVKLKRQLYDGGIIPYDNLYTTEYELVEQKNQLNKLLRQREIMLHQFAVLRGVSPEGGGEIERNPIDTLEFPFETGTKISSDLIFARPDVLQAEYGIKKVSFDVKAARKAFLPTIDLNEMVGFESLRASRLFNWDSTVYQLGAGLMLDLYTGGYKMSYLKYNKALAVEKLHQYNNVLLNAFCEAENAISSYKSDYRSYKDFKDTIDKSKHYYNVANIRYSNGTGNKIDELAARRQVLINENSMYQAKISSLVDTVNIYKSMGGKKIE